MSNTLTKDLGVTTTPGTPGSPGSPGSPPTPGFYSYTTTTTPTYTYQMIPLPLEYGETVVQYQMTAITGPPVTVTTSTWNPPTPGTPPVAAIAGTASTTVTEFNLGWNGGARSIASLTADGTATFSVRIGMIGGVVGLDSGAVEFSYAGAEHALYFRNGLVSVLESGTQRTGGVAFVTADVFRIERSGSLVRYYQNNTLLYTSTTPSYGTQYLEASLYSGGDAVLNAALDNTTTTAGYGTGSTVLLPLAASGSGHLEGDAAPGYAAGAAILLPLMASGTGYVQQGGGALLQSMQALGSNKPYATGSATLQPLGATGEAGTAPAFALGYAQLGYIGAAGYGITESISLNPAKSLGDSRAAWVAHVWIGFYVYLVSGTGAGQSLLIADNTGQSLLFNTAWSTAPDASSFYEIRDTLGNVLASGYVTPANSAMLPLAAVGSSYLYAGGAAALQPLAASGQAYVDSAWAEGATVAGVAIAPSPLGTGEVLALHDFTSQLGDATTRWVMDMITPAGAVRVPISNWQATLQTGSSCYVQCVVPACLQWLDAINTATEFVIYRRADVPGTALAIEYEMARAPVDLVQLDRGPQRTTCTLSGYTDAFDESLDPPTAFDRVLEGTRSVSSGSGLRVRCAIDWLLRPGHRAYVADVPFVARYINYYAMGSDSYMDVGE